jgi:hypothetical protein
MTRTEPNIAAAFIAIAVLLFASLYVCDCGNVDEYRARATWRAS